MRRLTFAIATVAVAGAGLALLVQHLRDREVPRFPAADVPLAVGSVHIHSDMSHDCDTPLTEIVDAARAAGLDFVILADHNEQYAGPMQRDGVTVLSYAELSTSYGHVMQLGASMALERAQRHDPAVLAGIRKNGGKPIVTHPADPKRPWTGEITGAAGVEIANLGSSTRRLGGAAFVGLLPMLGANLLNARLALTQLYDRDQSALESWDHEAAAAGPRFIGTCGNDAHGFLPTQDGILGWVTVLEGSLPLAEQARPAFILDELLAGHFYCSAGLLGPPPRLRFGAHKDGALVAGPGDSISVAQLDAITATISPAAVPGEHQIVMLRDGVPWHTGAGDELTVESPPPGLYRVEVWHRLPDLVYDEHLVPILYSQLLQVTAVAADRAPAPGAASPTTSPPAGVTSGGTPTP